MIAHALPCRLLPYAVAHGPWNMAADETLLESAAAGTASLRFYGWAEATLSLGYFQPESLRRGNPLLERLPCVRRPSGGGALVHHHEVTYALALPAAPPWQVKGARAWPCRMHAIIAAALEAQGMSLQISSCNVEAPPAEVLCFKRLTAGDLTLGAHKVVGSAQRRQRGALLQHGALLLAASPHAPLLSGIQELSGKLFPIAQVCAAIEREWSRQTGWSLRAQDWTAAERRRSDELVRTKYTQERWNAKR